MPLQLNNESDTFLITHPINIRGKGVILITVGYKAFISWLRERGNMKKAKKLQSAGVCNQVEKKPCPFKKYIYIVQKTLKNSPGKYFKSTINKQWITSWKPFQIFCSCLNVIFICQKWKKKSTNQMQICLIKILLRLITYSCIHLKHFFPSKKVFFFNEFNNKRHCKTRPAN